MSLDKLMVLYILVATLEYKVGTLVLKDKVNNKELVIFISSINLVSFLINFFTRN